MNDELSIYKYDLAISFAGEQRSIAESLASRLDASGYSIFYDQFETAQLWGTELPVKLGDIYEKQARYCLVVVSEEYVQKMWTNLERSFAISRAIKQRDDYILPLRIDGVELPGIPPTISYVDMNITSEDAIYGLLLQKLGEPHHVHNVVGISSEEQELVRELIGICNRRALFTKMDSEINMEAMFDSLGECLAGVQRISSKLHQPDLQYTSLLIVRDLDEIERLRMRDFGAISNFWPQRAREDMERLKISIIGHLHQIRRRSGIQFQMPTSLRFDHFYSVEQANERLQK
ncbi:MAG TPA: TIR domain-containing protein [Chthonomonadaceae bacterium]|nr:TIR domain-containing protein [Chthonomonadaceae bacterium]